MSSLSHLRLNDASRPRERDEKLRIILGLAIQYLHNMIIVGRRRFARRGAQR